MPWYAPSSADVLAQFNASEQAIIAGAQGAPCNVEAILAVVVAEIRDAIRSGANDLADDPTTIPQGLFNAAVDLTRWRLLLAVPTGKSLQTKAREDAAARAEKRLDDVAFGRYATEPPAAGANDRGGNWGSQNKLIPRTAPTPRPGSQLPVDPDNYANPLEPADSVSSGPDANL